MVIKILNGFFQYIIVNIYIFYGTDGDDWQDSQQKTLNHLESIVPHVNRIGFTVIKRSARQSEFESYLTSSNVFQNNKQLRLHVLTTNMVTNEHLADGIKTLVSE